MVRKTLYYVSFILIIFTISISLLSLIDDTEWRYLKMLDFARIQIFIVGLIAMLVFSFITKIWKWYDITLVAILALSLIGQVSHLINYTPLVGKSVPDSEEYQQDLSVLIYNVWIENTNYADAAAMIKQADADIVLALEVTKEWEEGLASLKEIYPFITETINNAGYGMSIYSKYKLEKLERYYLHNEKVPSYKFEISLNNKRCKVYTIHPPPPTFFEEMPDNQGHEEKELTIVGNMIKDDKLPVLVMGDLNDVAWGSTKQLMQASGKLHDVRVGRGMYNSFNAHSWWMSWPLDHVFVTNEFSLKDLTLLSNCGSDHYPIYASFTLN